MTTIATTRTWFAMSRIGLLPSPLARLHPRYRSPWVGVLVQLVVTLAVGLPIALHFGPTTAFVFLATILTGIMIAIYMIFNLSCIMYYLRRRRQEFNILLHLVIPVLGIITFVPAWLTAAGIDVFSFIAPLAPPYSYMGPGVAGFMILGVIYLIYLYRRHPRRVVEVGLVHIDPLEDYEG